MSDALDRLIALADAAQDPGDAVPAPAWALREVLAEREHLAKDLRECRAHLALAFDWTPAERKAAADWLADWDGTRADPGPSEEDDPNLPNKA